MKILTRKTPLNVLLLTINLILIAIVGWVVTADEATNTILDQSVYLYYFESDDALLDVGETQLYTFAPLPGEDVTIVVYGLDDFASPSVSLFGPTSSLIESASSLDQPIAEDTPEVLYITSIEYVATTEGLHHFEVKNESGEKGLVRTMLFVGEPINEDITLLDELNPLLPSKAFMVAGDPDREWENELTGETIQGLRTEVDVLPIERIDRTPDVFTSYSTLSYLPDINSRLEPVNFIRWFNEDEEEIYLVNIRPLPEEETEVSKEILQDLDYQSYNSNNFFFFPYFFTVGNGSDPVVLDRGAASRCTDRNGCVSSDPNLGRDVEGDVIPTTTTLFESDALISGEQITISIDLGATCTSFYGNGVPVNIGVTGISGTSSVCLPNAYVPAGNLADVLVGVTGISGTQNLCQGTNADDIIACTTGDDIINALAGDDAIFADAGNDDIDGGSGGDFIVAGAGNDYVDGGADNDGISGGTGDDTILGGAGIDALFSDEGNDTLNPGTSVPGTGPLTINWQSAFGGTGEDTIIIDSSHVGGDFTLVGGNDATTDPLNPGLPLGPGSSAIGDGENDTYSFVGNAQGTVYLWTDSADSLDFSGYNSGVNISPDSASSGGLFVGIWDGGLYANITGSNFNDNIILNSGCNFGVTSACGGSVPDYQIDAGGGNDTVFTGSGDDMIIGGAGNDNIDGGAGNDTFNESTTGNDLTVTILGSNPGSATGLGSDTLVNIENVYTGSGDDTVNVSDTANNIIDVNTGDDSVNVIGALTNNTITIDRTGTTVDATGTGVGTDQYLNVEQVDATGNTGNDVFHIFDENDNNLFGDAGNDTAFIYDASGTIIFTRSGAGLGLGDDVLIDSATTGTDNLNLIEAIAVITGATDDTFVVTDALTNLFDGLGGNDTIDYTSAVNDVVVTFGPGGSSTATGTDVGLDFLDNIENATTGSGNDTFNTADDSSNTFDGGAGTGDTYVYTGSDTDAITVNYDGSDGTVSSAGMDTDTVLNIENYTTGGGDDIFEIADNNSNTLDGAAGNDTYIYTGSSNADITVTYDGTTGTVSSSGMDTDTVNNIENYTTDSGDDIFNITDANDNIINAGTGNDTTNVGGSAVSNTFTVVRTGSNVTVTGTGIGNDTYNSIENINITGGTGDDVVNLTDSSNNIVDGNGGTNDVVNVVKNSNANGTITITRSGTDVDASGTGIGTDSYLDVDVVNVRGGTGNDTLVIQDENNNTFDGNGGVDTVEVTSANNGGETISIFRTGENVAVSSTGIGSDTYLDSDQVNITGGDGDDTFDIFDEYDNVFNGGAGTDTVDYTTTSANITVVFDVFSNTLVSGIGVGTDTLISIENLVSGGGDDTFTIQDEGNNTIDGAGGTDTVNVIMENTYSGVITIVRNPVNVVTVQGSGYGFDQFINIEQVNVESSTLDDIFRPDDNQNNIFDADAGEDWIDYSSLATGVNVNLSTNSATGDGSDELFNFENIFGTTSDDTLIGDANDNIITGSGGNDVIAGGAGTDTFDETDAIAGMTVNLTNNDQSGTSSGQGADTLSGIENVTTGGGNDIINLRESIQNIIDGGGGTNTVNVTNAETSSILTVTRSGTNVTLNDTSATEGFGDDIYNNVNQVNITGNTGTDAFTLNDANANNIDGAGGNDSVTYSTATDIAINFNALNTAIVTGSFTGTDTVTNLEEFNTGGGDDTFTFNSNVGNLTLNSGGGSNTYEFDAVDGNINITDTGGSTFLDFGGYTDGARIDLGSSSSQTVSMSDSSLIVTLNGTFDNIVGSTFSDNISGTSGVDTILGGNGNDFIWGEDSPDNLYGEDGDDYINGGAGSDILVGGAGNDTIDGGADIDTIDESASGDNLTVTLTNSTGSIVYPTETDTLLNIENVNTGSGSDTFNISDLDNNVLTDNGGADVANVSGGSGIIIINRDATGVDVSATGIGTDRYNGIETVNVTGSGTDDTFQINDSGDNTLDGAGGTDSIDYSSTPGSMTVTIVDNSATMSGSGIGSDVLLNIEEIITTNNADTFDLTGTVDYILNANGGIDTFTFNDGVNGTLSLTSTDGTFLDFSAFTSSGIDIDLSNTSGTQDVTGSLQISLTGVFNSIDGSTLADNISGTTSADVINAGGGNDILFGNAGNDTINGDAGDDQISGGIGVDILSGGADNDTINGGDDGDTLNGDAGTDTLNGDDGNDILNGGAGNDILNGGAGNDTLTGGADNDTIDGGADTDTFDESASSSNFTITMDSSGGTSTGNGNDTLTNIENLTTGSGDDTFNISDSADNVINANGGTNDIVNVINASGTVTITRAVSGDVTVTDTSGNVGNDLYQNVEFVNVAGGAGDDTFILTDELDNIINGQGGSNTIDYSGVTTVINVNVLAGSTQIIAPELGTDTLLNIQNITTGSNDDSFYVENNGVDNILDGGAGSFDDVTYSKITNTPGTISATRSGNSITIEVEGDTDELNNFETVIIQGSNSADTFIINDDQNNSLDGNGGTDTYDSSSFSSADTTVTTNGGTITVDSSDVGTDTLVEFEQVTTGAGNDRFVVDTSQAGTYIFDAGSSTLGNIFEFTNGGGAVVRVTISTSSGNLDTLDFSGFSGGAIDIDLSDNTEQEVATNLFITFNNFVANVVGTDNGDTIEGNSLDNNIDAGAGNDTIIYSEGDDTIDGGADTDTVDYSTAPDAITATLTSGTDTINVSGTTKQDDLDNVEIITATDNDDTIVVMDAVTTTVNAGNGTDTIDYSGLSEAVNVDLSTNTGTIDSTDHTINDVEDVIGSGFDDTIVGNTEDNTIDGGAGNDDIDGGAGNDTISGGSGNDVIKGSSGNDKIRGNSGNDRAYGGDGNDEIDGDEDDDLLYGGNISGTVSSGDGSDIINGGDGLDTIYGGNDNDGGGTTTDAGDIIDGGDDADLIYGGNNNANAGGGTGTEGDDGNDTITGGEGNDVIYGGNNNTDGGLSDDGSDNINGDNGNDTIYGGNNNDNGGSSGGRNDDEGDVIEGSTGDDTLYGGNSNINGGEGDDNAADTITDTTGGDTDTVYGGNDNTGGGTGDDAGDSINVADGDNNDAVVGDNHNGGGSGGTDTITRDSGDTENTGSD